MVAVIKSLVFICFLLIVCYRSSTTELLETVMHLLNGSARFYPHGGLNMVENLIVCLEVAVDSVQLLVDLLDRGARKQVLAEYCLLNCC